QARRRGRQHRHRDGPDVDLTVNLPQPRTGRLRAACSFPGLGVHSRPTLATPTEQLEVAMAAEDIFSLLIPVTFVLLLAIESLFRTGRPWPKIPWWRSIGIAFFVLIMTINIVLPLLIPPELSSHHLLDASRLGLAGSIVLGYLVLSFATATIHRAYHRY